MTKLEASKLIARNAIEATKKELDKVDYFYEKSDGCCGLTTGIVDDFLEVDSDMFRGFLNTVRKDLEKQLEAYEEEFAVLNKLE